MDTSWTAAEIEALRHRLGLTQVRFAEVMGVTRGAVGHWTGGKRTPPKAKRYTLSCLARLYALGE